MVEVRKMSSCIRLELFTFNFKSVVGLCLGASLSALFFSGWFMGASSKYKQHSLQKSPVF